MFRTTSAVLSVILFCSAGATANAETPTGSVRGRVSSDGTKAYLQGADVAITELRLSAYTDREGEFLLVGVPVGTHQLRVNYTGFTTRTVAVAVSPGATARLDVEMGSEIQQLQAFNVTADKEGRALAIMQQRAADNVKNVVSADAFGSAAEGNVADLLQRLPGITVSYTSADPDQVSIRGVSPELSTVTIDGVPVSNAVAGTARTFRFTLTSNISMLESVEVTKALTPEMDAASVGGAINIRSKTPFQSKVTESFDYQLGGNLETRSDSAHRMNPTMSAHYARVFGTCALHTPTCPSPVLP